MGGGRADEGVDGGRTADGTPRFRQALLPTRPGEKRRPVRVRFPSHPLSRYPSSAQGDFFVHFLDSAEEELVKPVAQIAKGRLQSKLELSLRQVCGAAATTTSTSTATTSTSTSTFITSSTFTSTTSTSTLRQAAVADAFKDALGCDLAPYNLTNQLLRVINTTRGSGVAPPPQAADRTPGLDAFTFDYKVEWPLSLVLSKNSITK